MGIDCLGIANSLNAEIRENETVADGINKVLGMCIAALLSGQWPGAATA
jgi:hypothetical protein